MFNAHTHLELSHAGHLCPAVPVAFADWVAGMVAFRRDEDVSQRQAACCQGVAQLVACGTARVGDISSDGASVRPLLEAGIGGVVYLEVLGLSEAAGLAMLEGQRRRLDGLRKRCEGSQLRIGLSPHATWTLHPALWEPCLALARDEGLPLCIHCGESPAEAQLFASGQGALTELLKRQGCPLPQAGQTPVGFLQTVGALGADVLLAHGVQVDAADVALLKETGTAVAHCPRSNQLLSCGTLPLDVYVQAGAELLLGTDGLVSAPSLDVHEELAAAVAMHGPGAHAVFGI